jgi:hypothetical protein
MCSPAKEICPTWLFRRTNRFQDLIFLVVALRFLCARYPKTFESGLHFCEALQ